jgi:O-antigen ligase
MNALLALWKNVARNQLWLSLAIALILLFPHLFTNWLWIVSLALMTLPWAFRTFDADTRGKFPIPSVLLAALLWTYLPSLYASSNPILGLEKCSQTLVGTGILAGLLNKERTGADLDRLLYGSVIACAGVAVIAPFVTYLWWPAKFIKFLPSSPMQLFGWRPTREVNPNVLAGLMVMMIPVATGLWAARRFSRWVLTLVLAAMTTFLVLSQSRSGCLGAAVAMLLMACLAGKKWCWTVVGTLVATLMGLLCLGNSTLHRMLWNSFFVGPWELRPEFWNRGLLMLQSSPLTGTGPGMYGQIAHDRYPFEMLQPDIVVSHAHNHLLQVGVDLGIPGLVIYSAILGYALSCVRGLGKSPDRQVRAGLLCGLIAMLIHGLFDCVFWGSRVSPAHWFVIGMLVTMTAGARRPWLRPWQIMGGWGMVSALAIVVVKEYAYVCMAIAVLSGGLLGFFAEPLRQEHYDVPSGRWL